jgi:hypothetical protein
MAAEPQNVAELRQSLGEASLPETMERDAVQSFDRGYDVDEDGVFVQRPPSPLPLIIATPPVMVELLTGMRLFGRTRTIERDIGGGFMRRVEFMYGRAFLTSNENHSSPISRSA